MVGLGHAIAKRANAKRIAKSDDPIAGNLSHTGICPFHPTMDFGNRLENRIRVERHTTGGCLQLVGQHIEQHFRIGLGIDVPPIEAKHLFLELSRIGEVAVVSQRQTEGRIDVKGLRLLIVSGRPGGRITHMRNPAAPWQSPHIPSAKDIANLPTALVHREGLAVRGGDAGGILAAMLQQEQSVIEKLIDR